MKLTRKILASVLVLVMVLLMLPTAMAAENNVYVLDVSNDLEEMSASADNAGKELVVKDYFTVILGEKTKIDSSKKTFEDGYSATVRLNFQHKTKADENGVILPAVKFTTSGAATIKLWWVSGGEGRYMAILDAEGKEVTISEAATDSNQLYITELSLDAAGTYYLGTPNGSNYLFKMEVTEAAAEEPAEAKTITIGDKTFTAEGGKWLYNADVDAAGAAKNSMLIFDKNYAGSVAINGYGAAIVLNQYGSLIKVYDGANLGFYTEAGVKTTAHFTTSDYASVAFSELQEGELLIIFPNDGAANEARAWALGLRGLDGKDYFAETAALTGFTFEKEPTDDKTITIGDKTLTVEEGKWLYNADVDAAGAAKNGMLIFDKNYAGSVAINGYGAAIVLNQYGKMVKLYDGANLGFYTEAGVKTTAHFTTGDYASVAFSELKDGELLIIFPNDGGANAARAWALGLRGLDGKDYFAEIASLTGFTFEKEPTNDKTITIGDKTFTAEEGKWLYNADVEAADAAKNSMLIFDKNYAGSVAINGYGAAIVLDQYGKMVKLYDGANLGFYTEAGVKTTAHFTTGDYASVAFSELKDGELLIIFPNDGGANAARAWALGLRGLDGKDYFAEAATLTGFEFKEEPANPSDPVGPPATGDMTFVVVAIMLVSAMALVVLVNKKRAF